MAQAELGQTVRVHYTGKLADGTVFGGSPDEAPIEFTIGEGSIMPALERCVIGMDRGDTKTAQVPADQAFGPHREELAVAVDRGRLPAEVAPEVGQQLEIRQEEGSPLVVTITDVSESTVTLDANHPLAGKDLSFEIELLEIVE